VGGCVTSSPVSDATRPGSGTSGDDEDAGQRPPFADEDELVAWLESLPPLDQARVASLLVDTENIRRVGRIRRAAIYELTRSMTYAEVAAALGMSVSAVNNAVTAHRRDAG
jgi:DNA-directed RNA polymerase specialized sigma24 family protein